MSSIRSLSGADDNAPLSEKCWICLGTAMEDPPNGQSHDWKYPCKCSLVAHEACLLSWISQTGVGSASARRDDTRSRYFTIPCPQCKSSIYVCDKNSMSLLLYQLNRLQNGLSITARRFIYLNVITTVTSTLFVVTYSTLYMIGSYSVQMMCPPDMACQVLGLTRTLLGTRVAPVTFKRMFYIPMIPITLAMSRGDSIFGRILLNLLPLSVIDRDHGLLSLTGPRLAIAVLPYIRMTYDYLHNRFLAPWLWRRLVSRPIDHYNLEMPDDPEENNAAGFHIEVQIAEDDPENPENRENDMDNIPDIQHDHHNNHAGLLNAEFVFPTDTLVTILWRLIQKIRRLLRPVFGPLPQETRDILKLITGKQLAPLRLVNGILLPYYGAGLGTLLSLIPLIRRLMPNKFTRSLVSGCLIVVLKDILNIYTRAKVYDAGDKQTILNGNEITKFLQSQPSAGAAATAANQEIPLDIPNPPMAQDMDQELPMHIQQALARAINIDLNQNNLEDDDLEDGDDNNEVLDIIDMHNQPQAGNEADDGNLDDDGNWNINMQVNFAWE